MSNRQKTKMVEKYSSDQWAGEAACDPTDDLLKRYHKLKGVRGVDVLGFFKEE